MKPEPLKGKRCGYHNDKFWSDDIRAAVEWIKEMVDLVCDAHEEKNITDEELEWWDDNIFTIAFEDVMK